MISSSPNDLPTSQKITFFKTAEKSSLTSNYLSNMALNKQTIITAVKAEMETYRSSSSSESEDENEEKKPEEKPVEKPEEDSDEDSDEDEEEPEPDEYYIGTIPKNCTKDKLAKIMAKAVIKLRQERKGYRDCTTGDILDRWFEHDARGDDKFDHIVPTDDFDEWLEKVESYITKWTSWLFKFVNNP